MPNAIFVGVLPPASCGSEFLKPVSLEYSYRGKSCNKERCEESKCLEECVCVCVN